MVDSLGGLRGKYVGADNWRLRRQEWFSRALPRTVQKKRASRRDTTGSGSPTDKTEVVSAPEYLEVFARMAHVYERSSPVNNFGWVSARRLAITSLFTPAGKLHRALAAW